MARIKKIDVEYVGYIPKILEEGILYVSNEYGTAAHLCACGCGTKVRTPLSPTDWFLQKDPQGVSLFPSIGNWQLKCQSHYWIRNGRVVWSGKWTPKEIEEGRIQEQERAKEYFNGKLDKKENLVSRIKAWIKSVIG